MHNKCIIITIITNYKINNNNNSFTTSFLRRRKSSMWDQPPPGFEGLDKEEIKQRLAQQTALAQANAAAASATTTAANTTPVTPGGPPPFVPKIGRIPNVILPQMPITPQEKQARRLFVGNIPPGVDEFQLKFFFNQKFAKEGLIYEGEDAIASVQINREKNYSFLEMLNTELATKGMEFDGVLFENQPLKVRRPKDFQATPQTDMAGFDSDTVQQHLASMREAIKEKNFPHLDALIYMGGIPISFSENQVKDVIAPYGDLKRFTMTKDSHDRVCAYFEFNKPESNERICKELHGRRVEDSTLFVQKASLGTKNLPPNAFYSYSDNSLILNLLNLNIPVSSTLNSSLYFQTNPTFLNPRPTPILVYSTWLLLMI
jgi:splicing factor U2AF 65 kDa subunit